MLAGLLAALDGIRAARAADIVVGGAASLTQVFVDIRAAFESTRPDTSVRLTFDASGTLLKRIEQDAQFDVLAVADEETMDDAHARGLIDTATRREFATNVLVLVQAVGSAPLIGIEDLVRSPVRRVAIGDPETVPAGRYAREALQSEGSWSRLGMKLVLANSVRQVLDFVVHGQADVGFVYASDAMIARDVLRVIGPIMNARPVRYSAAVLAGTGQAEAAGAFVAFLGGAEARGILTRHGFGIP